MEINLFLLSIVIAQALIVLIVRTFLPSYLKEKAKNLATKEDISKITELVEAVKHTFTKETEILKADLNLLTGFHGGLLAEEKNAVIDLNEKYFAWLNILLDPSMGNIDTNKNEELEKFQIQLGLTYNMFLNSETRFRLFVRNAPLTKLLQDMKIATLKLLGNISNSLAINLQYNNKALALIADRQDQLAEMQELHKKRQQLIKDANADVVKNYEQLVKMNVDFQELCRNHIHDLIKRPN